MLAIGMSISGFSSCSGPASRPSVGERVLGIEELSRLDLLPRLKQSVKIGCVSSYDPTGENDDGFSGKYSYLRKEPQGLVIADLQGPGVIYRIQIPSPTDEIVEFYFDGESKPRISRKIPELFQGNIRPFLSPLVGAGVGGRFSYVPLTYQHSCKVIVKTETFHFFQLNYARYPDGFVIPTYQDPPSEEFRRHLEAAIKLFSRVGSDITSALIPANVSLKTKAVQGILQPGRTVILFKKSGPGRILGLRLGPASAFAGGDRDILIKIYWDSAREPAVECPVSDFFGYSFGDPAVRSLLLGTSGDTNYIYFPMPFENSARIELVSQKAEGPAVNVQAEVVFADLGKAVDEGRFYASWRRENPCTEGKPFTYLRTTGHGHIVGMILQAQGLETGSTGFFEGDDRAIIDGELAIPGTGSEDSFNGGWYDVPGRWENRYSFPFSGCLDYKKPLARTGGYRWLVTDAYSYSKSIDYTIEHGPAGNKWPADYTGVTFFYSLDPPPADSPLPRVSERKVSDPDRIVFVPGWNVPIHTSSLQNATWSKQTEKIGDRTVRYFSIKTSGEDIFGSHHISFICDIPSAGDYKISVKGVRGRDQGILQIFRHDLPAGEAVNLYAEDRCVSGELPLGIQEMKKGDNLLFLHLVARDARSKGLGLDLIEIIFERIK